MIGFGWKNSIGLFDILGIQINPATAEGQDAIVDAINAQTGGGATELGVGNKNVSVAGTAEKLTASTTPIKRVHIRAKAANTNYMFVGNASVTSTNGIFLGPQDSITINISDLSAVWINSAVNGEGVQFTYEA